VARKFTICLGRNDEEHFQWEVIIFKNSKQLHQGRNLRLKKDKFKAARKQRVKACVISYKLTKGSTWRGVVLFSEENLNRETLLHESIHMAWRMADYLRKYTHEFCGYKRDFEEMLCTASGIIFQELHYQIKRKQKR
jgi:hypothetical protein